MIDPGRTGTYIVNHISSFLSLKTGKEHKLDVQFLSLSRSLSVSATSFDIAPYADNDNKFHVQHAFSTPNINLQPADTKELNDICQQFPQLRHIKFSDINQGKIGVLLGTACVPFTHSLEWIRGAHNRPSGIRTELGWTIAGEFRHSFRSKSTAAKHLLFFASHEPSPQSASTDILELYWNFEKMASAPTQKRCFVYRRQRSPSDTSKHLPPQWQKVRNRTSLESRHATPEQLLRRIKPTPQPRNTLPKSPIKENQIRRNLAEGS